MTKRTKPTRAGRLIIAGIRRWLAESDRRYRETGRYCTDQEIADVRAEKARLDRQRNRQRELALNTARGG